jgi:ubiquinone/menaquinone biosynthesis C-methylase UbiE
MDRDPGFVQQKIDFLSLDPSERGAQILAKHLGIDSGENGRLRVGYAHHIPFDNNSFDVVVLSEVLERIPTEKLQASLEGVSKSMGLVICVA